jgi:beta-glucosidase
LTSNSRLVDELLSAGIEPFATLYHWAVPQALHFRNGGWRSTDTVKAFAEYAGFVAEQLSDRVTHFFTINAFRSFVDAGYRGTEVQVGGGTSVHLGAPPELQLPTGEFNQVRHHTVVAHGLAVQAPCSRRGRHQGRAGREHRRGGPGDRYARAR